MYLVLRTLQQMLSLVIPYRSSSNTSQGQEPHRLQYQASSGQVSTRLALRELERIASQLIKNSLADSTRRSYATGQSKYLEFCQRYGLTPLPATQRQLILFAADLSLHLSYATIRSYLSAIRFLHLSNGYTDPTACTPQLSLLLKGARRRNPAVRDRRLPITPLILEKMYSVLDTPVWPFEDKLIWAACCLGFFGFLRSGEFTVAVGNLMHRGTCQ